MDKTFGVVKEEGVEKIGNGFHHQEIISLYYFCIDRLEVVGRPHDSELYLFPIFFFRLVWLTHLVIANVSLGRDFFMTSLELGSFQLLRSITFNNVEFARKASKVLEQLDDMIEHLKNLETLAVVNCNINPWARIHHVFLLMLYSDSLRKLFWYPSSTNTRRTGFDMLARFISETQTVPPIDRVCTMILLDLDPKIFQFLSSPKSYEFPEKLVFDVSEHTALITNFSLSLRIAVKHA